MRTVALAGALVVGVGCGRLGFGGQLAPDGADAPDATSCIGDFLVDTTADDPGQALGCTGAGCSLRAAVARANAGTRSTICVADGLAVAILITTSPIAPT